MKEKRTAPPAVGSTSMLVSLGVLLLAMLALLSLGQARADGRLSEESAKHVEEFYNADMEAEKILGLLRNGVKVEEATLDDGIWSYCCPMSRYQTLFVEVEDGTWEILRWETVTHPETPNEDLDVWKEQ